MIMYKVIIQIQKELQFINDFKLVFKFKTLLVKKKTILDAI